MIATKQSWGGALKHNEDDKDNDDNCDDDNDNNDNDNDEAKDDSLSPCMSSMSIVIEDCFCAD